MFQRTLMTIATFLVVIASTALAQPYGNGFAGKDLSAYLDEPKKANPDTVALVSVKGMTGKQALKLANGAKVTFKRVPVDDKTKYTLAFRGRYDGGEAVEENPTLEHLTARFVPNIFPSREIRFFDAAGKNLPGGFRSGMVFRNWQEYRDIFYPPAGAVAMDVVIHSGRKEITFFVDAVTFEKTPDEGAINPNPVIAKYGKHNYSGWANLAAGAKIVEEADGRVAFDTKYGTRSLSFPLTEPGTYGVTAKGEGNGYNAVIILDFLDAQGKKLGSMNANASGKEFKAVAPAGTVRGSFLVYSHFLEELRINKVAD